jgi:hypothetical protein
MGGLSLGLVTLASGELFALFSDLNTAQRASGLGLLAQACNPSYLAGRD